MKKITIILITSFLTIMTNAAFAASYGFHPGGGRGYSASTEISTSNSGWKSGWGYNKRTRASSTSSSGSLWGFAGRSMPSQVASSGGKQFIFNPHIHMWAVYDASGERVQQGIANGGGDYCYDVHRGCHTPGGVHHIMSKKGADCKSSRFPIKHINGQVVRGGAEMPYCSFFSSNYAIHGHEGLVDGNVSHGCIRVSNEAAQWIQGYLPIGAKVTVLPY